MKVFFTYLTFLTFLIGAQGLDLELRNVVCDESLPAYISEGDISWKCSDGGTACSMGDTVSISGGSKYQS
jgi:hypothetical protein